MRRTRALRWIEGNPTALVCCLPLVSFLQIPSRCKLHLPLTTITHPLHPASGSCCESIGLRPPPCTTERETEAVIYLSYSSELAATPTLPPRLFPLSSHGTRDGWPSMLQPGGRGVAVDESQPMFADRRGRMLGPAHRCYNQFIFCSNHHQRCWEAATACNRAATSSSKSYIRRLCLLEPEKAAGLCQATTYDRRTAELQPATTFVTTVDHFCWNQRKRRGCVRQRRSCYMRRNATTTVMRSCNRQHHLLQT